MPLFIFLVMISQPLTVYSPTIVNYQEYDNLPILSNNTLKGYNMPFRVDTMTLGIILATRNDYEVVGENTLLQCLIRKESSGNPLAYNPKDPNGGSFGILQYQIKTFETFCVKRYGFKNDIMNPEIQIQCAQKMIDEDFNNVYHWTTALKCL